MCTVRGTSALIFVFHTSRKNSMLHPLARTVLNVCRAFGASHLGLSAGSILVVSQWSDALIIGADHGSGFILPLCFMICCNEEERDETIPRIVSLFMSTLCLFVACREGSSSYYFTFFDHHQGSTLPWIPPSLLENFEVPRLYFFINIVCWEQALFFLVLRRTSNIDGPHYGGTKPFH